MRKHWLDYLRVMAILAVVMGHIIVDFYKLYGKVGQAEWWLADFFTAFLRFAVPIFVMTSGAVLLGRSYTMGEFYKKRALRLLPPIIFWNLIYLFLYILDGMDKQTVLWTLKARVITDGHIAPHMWYLSMFVCLMVFVPFINKFIVGEKPNGQDLAVLLGVSFPFFLLNTVASVADNVYKIPMEWFKIFPWYIVYFVAGYYIDNYSDKIRIKNSLIITFIVILIAIGMVLNYYAVSSLGILKDYFIVTEMGPLVFLMSMLIFKLGKNLSPILTENKFVSAIAEASFGMYLIHEIFNMAFYKILPDFYSHGLIYIPLTFILTATLSFISIYLLRKIPVMRWVC